MPETRPLTDYALGPAFAIGHVADPLPALIGHVPFPLVIGHTAFPPEAEHCAFVIGHVPAAPTLQVLVPPII